MSVLLRTTPAVALAEGTHFFPLYATENPAAGDVQGKATRHRGQGLHIA